MAAGQGSRHRAGGIRAQTVAQLPLTPLGLIEIAADSPPEADEIRYAAHSARSRCCSRSVTRSAQA